MALHQQLYCLNKALVMELHQVLELFYLSGNVVRKELRERRLIVTVVLILDNHKISVLL